MPICSAALHGLADAIVGLSDELVFATSKIQTITSTVLHYASFAKAFQSCSLAIVNLVTIVLHNASDVVGHFDPGQMCRHNPDPLHLGLVAVILCQKAFHCAAHPVLHTRLGNSGEGMDNLLACSFAGIAARQDFTLRDLHGLHKLFVIVERGVCVCRTYGHPKQN